MSGYSIPHRLALLATSPVATGEPRKGTETMRLDDLIDLFLVDLRTRTPQGDGNPRLRVHFS